MRIYIYICIYFIYMYIYIYIYIYIYTQIKTQNDGNRNSETLLLAIKMCTGFTTDGICMNAMSADDSRSISDHTK